MFIPLTPIRCLYRAMDLYGKKTGIISGEDRYTYAQFVERCERLAGGLLSEGTRPGDRIAYLSYNTSQLLEGYYGPPLIRAITMPLNVRLTASELTEILNHSGARMLLFEADFVQQVQEFRQCCPQIERYVSLDGFGTIADITYEEILGRNRIDRPDVFSFDENEIAELFYTSGSTGTPKGVALSHRTIYLHALDVTGSIHPKDFHVEMHTIPLFHANGWGRPQTATMTGCKQVMVRRFEPISVLQLIQKERASHMSLVPVMANALLNSPALEQFDLSSMEQIHLGGAAASPELIERLERVFKCEVMSGYGLTETCPVATSAMDKDTFGHNSEEDRLRFKSMAGWPVLGCEIRVVDERMRNVARDMQSIGEVVIRSDHVMEGYFREPAGTENAITDGWLHTGDMATWDEENVIQIVDRKKDIIISGGENISSIEVENAIVAHPLVVECAVVSAPDSKWGEIPVAIVVVKEGWELADQELLTFLEARVAKFKLPRSIRFIEGPLPKTGTGKILKRELREPFWIGKPFRVQGI